MDMLLDMCTELLQCAREVLELWERDGGVCTRAFKQTLHEDSWSCSSQHLRRGGEIRSWYHVRGGSSKSEHNNKTAHKTHNNTVSWFIPLQSNSQNAHQTRWTKPRRKTRAHCTFFSSRPVLAYSARTCSLPYLVVLLNVTQLWEVGLVNPSYNDCYVKKLSFDRSLP